MLMFDRSRHKAIQLYIYTLYTVTLDSNINQTIVQILPLKFSNKINYYPWCFFSCNNSYILGQVFGVSPFLKVQ